MALMCKMDACKEKKGMCLHEISMVAGIVLVVGAVVIFLR